MKLKREPLNMMFFFVAWFLCLVFCLVLCLVDVTTEFEVLKFRAYLASASSLSLMDSGILGGGGRGSRRATFTES